MKPQLRAVQAIIPAALFDKPDAKNIQQVLTNTVDYLVRLNRSLEIELSKRTPDDQVQTSLYLSSPNGSIYQIKVSDAGVISATLVLNPV